MRGSWKVASLLTVIALVAAVSPLAAPKQAQARPKYMAVFKQTYPNPKLAGQVEATKCNVCHFGKEKKDRNDYGMAISNALGEAKNVKAADEIAKALKTAEKAASSTEGKTFGDLIKDGQLPGKSPE